MHKLLQKKADEFVLNFPLFNCRTLQEREIIVYCDLHGHSRKQNVFIYGCENRHHPDKRLRERIFPAMLNRNAPDKVVPEAREYIFHSDKS